MSDALDLKGGKNLIDFKYPEKRESRPAAGKRQRPGGCPARTQNTKTGM